MLILCRTMSTDKDEGTDIDSNADLGNISNSHSVGEHSKICISIVIIVQPIISLH